MVKKEQYVVWFKDVDKDDGKLVGGKGANLGEMVRSGFPVPNGFIVTSSAYSHFLDENNLKHPIKNSLAKINYSDQTSLEEVSAQIKKMILAGEFPKELAIEIMKYYHHLGHHLKGAFHDEIVAVRSSATAEDLKNASFAGQQETFLNISGEHNVLEAIKKVWASLFDARALFYRKKNGMDNSTVGIAVPVQKMIESDASGVMFTLDPVTNDKSKIVIEAIYGLGELIVQGEVTPDHYEVDKKTDKIVLKTIREQDFMLMKQGKENKKVKVAHTQLKRQKISDSQIEKLAEIGRKLEHHYFFPQDVEWAITGNEIYIVQTRPVTTTQIQRDKILKVNSLKLDVLLRGDPASPGMASGTVKIIKDIKDLPMVEKGDVLVTPQTNPDFVSAMRKAVAIVTERGGRTSHAAIVSRELGIPSVVGATLATKLLNTGIVVTVNGTTGEVFKGGIQSSEWARFANRVQNSKLDRGIKTKTKLYVNLAEPERAIEVSMMDVDGVGLLRAEFMIADIGVHPKKMIDERRKKEFIALLSEKLHIFSQAFYPRPVVYRTSDFKTNEYSHLKGGEKYEPKEENPMIGFRGTYRYVKDPEVFEMELEAMRRVRSMEKGNNLALMIPFARRPEELVEVMKILHRLGMMGSSTFKVWLMVETPANVISLAKFLSVGGIDGISIGSNDLTMLTLGVDRDNNNVSEIFDEGNDAVLWSIEHAIKTAHSHKITSSICGQLPSVHPELIEKLIGFGITSISVSPDAVSKARGEIARVEEKFKKN